MDATLLAGEAVKSALKKGCDNAELFIKTAKRFSVEVKKGSIDALESANDFGMSLRVIKKQRLGFSFATSPDMLEDMVNEAVNGADWTAVDEHSDIPEHNTASGVLVFDNNIKNIRDEDIAKHALFLEETALKFDKRIKKVRKAEIALAAGNTTIFNSKGIHVSYESSYITATVTVFADDGNDTQTGWDFAASRRLEDIDFVSVAEGAAKKALNLLGSKKITSVKVPVILDSSVATDFLHILSASLSAEAVQKKRSFLAGKVGKNIVSNAVNIFDDACMPWKIGSKPVDDEGVPTSRKNIISEGILTGFIHNTYTARKEGVTSTGNAIRRSFKSLPGIDVTNFYIEPGRNGGKQDNNLMKRMSRGLLILETMGIHTANPISGEFSIGISGLWIENGETAFPVKEAVMSGNILELFKKIDAVGDDLRFYGNIGSPSLLIGSMDISA